MSAHKDMSRLIIAMGTGKSDVSHAGAAQAALEQALQHSSWTILKARGIAPSDMRVKVTIGVDDPAQVSRDNLMMPFEAEVEIVQGGLLVRPDGIGAPEHVAAAAVEVFLPSQS